MFSKSSVFAVVALAAFVSLGGICVPAGRTCAVRLGLRFGQRPYLTNPWGNSPGYDIVYCFDQDCVKNQLKDSNG